MRLCSKFRPYLLKMKFIITSAFLILLSSVFSQIETHRIYNISVEQIAGKWHIDSTSESGHNMRPAIYDEYFVFLEDKTFLAEKVENEDTTSNKLGTFEIISDSLKIKTLIGAPFMEFIITQNSNNLELWGTFEISDYNKSHPTFYLSNKKGDKEVLSTSVIASDRQVLFRSVENKITLKLDPTIEEYVVECPLCNSFEAGEEPYTYVLIPGRGKYTSIVVKSRSLSLEVISKFRMATKNLPCPVLFFGDIRNGRKCTLDSKTISARYTSEMNIDLESKIETWELHVKDKSFNGQGNELTEEAQIYLSELTDTGIVSIIALVRGPDGIGRRIGGVYIYSKI